MVYTMAIRASKGCFSSRIHSACPVHPYSLNSNSDLYSNHVCAFSHPENIQVAQIVSEARLVHAIDHVYKVDVPLYNIRTSLFLEGLLSLFVSSLRKGTRVFAPEGRLVLNGKPLRERSYRAHTAICSQCLFYILHLVVYLDDFLRAVGFVRDHGT